MSGEQNKTREELECAVSWRCASGDNGRRNCSVSAVFASRATARGGRLGGSVAARAGTSGPGAWNWVARSRTRISGRCGDGSNSRSSTLSSGGIGSGTSHARGRSRGDGKGSSDTVARHNADGVGLGGLGYRHGLHRLAARAHHGGDNVSLGDSGSHVVGRVASVRIGDGVGGHPLAGRARRLHDCLVDGRVRGLGHRQQGSWRLSAGQEHCRRGHVGVKHLDGLLGCFQR